MHVLLLFLRSPNSSISWVFAVHIKHLATGYI